jgi:hypothetical protein
MNVPKIVLDRILYPVKNAPRPPLQEVIWGISSDSVCEKIAESLQWTDFYYHIANMSYHQRLARILMKVLMQQLPISYTRTIAYLKFDFLKNVYGNVLYDLELKDEIFLLFCKYQRIQHLFSRLSYRRRVRRAKVQITTDLYMNELTPSHKYTIELYHHGAIYLFSMTDLSRIWISALTNASAFFSMPNSVKNPYTNIPFTKSELCAIYHRMYESRFRIPLFIQQFYRCNLNIYEFKRRHESELRNHILYEYAMKTSANIIVTDIRIMIRLYDRIQQISIHPDFPVDALVKPMRIYLYYYYQRLYAYEKSQRNYYDGLLYLKLRQFIYHNPLFGRKYTTEQRDNTRFPYLHAPSPLFHTKIEKGFTESVTEYISSHEYNDSTFNRYMLYNYRIFEDDTDDDTESNPLLSRDSNLPHQPETPPWNTRPMESVAMQEYLSDHDDEPEPQDQDQDDAEEVEVDETIVYMDNEEDNEEDDSNYDVDETDYDP